MCVCGPGDRNTSVPGSAPPRVPSRPRRALGARAGRECRERAHRQVPARCLDPRAGWGQFRGGQQLRWGPGRCAFFFSRRNALTLPFGKRDRETGHLLLSGLGKQCSETGGAAPPLLSSVACGVVLGGIPALSEMSEKRASEPEPTGLSNPAHNSWPPGPFRIGQASPASPCHHGERVDTASSNHETAGLPEVSAESD